jgi:hypothetical protein
MTPGSAAQKRYAQRFPEKVRVFQRRNETKRRKRARLLLIEKYGGRCVCVCGCSENRAPFLTIDHVHGRQTEIASNGKRLGASQLVKRLGRLPVDQNFRLLCYNCNCGHRTIESVETSPKALVAKEWRLEIRKELVERYGARCRCCRVTTLEFLTFDHVHGGGGKEFRQPSGRGRNTFRFLLTLRKESGCREDIQLLCFNCNCSRQHHEGVCPHSICPSSSSTITEPSRASAALTHCLEK